MICSICIATYKRPYLLRELLNSILSQKLFKNIILQVVIVDNDNDKSAEKIVQEYKNSEKITFEYYVQPKKNISLTRNAAVKKSIGEYLLFIDDDEKADENWISEHLSAITKYNADGVFGCVLPEFHEKTPEWLINGDYFIRHFPATGNEATFLGTGNCIIKSNIIKSEQGPFNLKLGITGGEDTHLFSGLRKKGAKFISCREAIVTEFIPPERTKVKWLFKKSFQTGSTATRRMIENANNKFSRKLELFIRAVIFEMISVIFFIVYLPSKRARTKWLMKVASNAGHILAVMGVYYKGYK